MRILITGICGFAGSTLARDLREHRENLEIVGIDNLSRKGSETNLPLLRENGIDVRVGDVRNRADLDAFGNVDWLIDAAANPSVLAGVDGKTSSAELLDHNLVGTIPMLEFCHSRSIPFTLLSTSRVYGIHEMRKIRLETEGTRFVPEAGQSIPGFSANGIAENFSTEPPVSLYGASKRCAELLALEYSETFGFPVWVNRCGVLAGAGQFGKPDQGIFSYWIHSWAGRHPLKYLGFGGNGHQVRDCLHPKDMVPLLWKQYDAGSDPEKPRIVNLSGGIESATSLADLSAWCSANIGGNDVVRDGGDRLFDIPWVVLDHSLASYAWDWKPQTSRDAILRDISDHAKRFPEWLSISS
jgi:CDP-paratose 2-epimerase